MIQGNTINWLLSFKIVWSPAVQQDKNFILEIRQKGMPCMRPHKKLSIFHKRTDSK